MNRLAGLTLVALFVVAGLAAASSFSVDENPAGFSSVTPYGDDLIDAMWDLQFSFDLTIATGAAGNAGSEFDGTNYYSTRWAANLIHETDLAGTLIREFSIPGVSGLRDLAYDGTYFYGGASGSVIYEMDFVSETLVGSMSNGALSVRAIAYNEDNDTFYSSNWADPVNESDRGGNIVGSFNLGTTTSTYGFAYETACSGAPTLWVHDQTAGGCVIHAWDLGSGSFTGVTHDVNSDFANSGIAGGLWFVGPGTLGGLSQGVPDMAFGYELCGAGADLEIDIIPVNGTNFQPGDWIDYEVILTNNTGSPINVDGRAYASNNADWQFNLFGPINFNIPGNHTIGPVPLSSQVPNGAPSMSAFICAEANDVHDCYEVTVTVEGECAHPVEESGINQPGTTGWPHTLANICTADVDGVITKIGVDRWNTDTATWTIFLWDINCNLMGSVSVTGGTGWYFADIPPWSVTAGQQFYVGYEVSEGAGSYLYRDTASPVDVGHYTVEYANYYSGGGGCPTSPNGPMVTAVDVEFCPDEDAVIEPPAIEFNAVSGETLLETDVLLE